MNNSIETVLTPEQKVLSVSDEQVDSAKSPYVGGLSRNNGQIQLDQPVKITEVRVSNLRKGNLVSVQVLGSVRNSEFYYQVKAKNAKSKIKNDQVIMNSDKNWRPITLQGIFEVEEDGPVFLELHFFIVKERGSGLSGKFSYSNLSMIAKKF